MLTKKYLNSLFEYKDGMLFWKVKLNKSVVIGSRAGTFTFHGRRAVVINKVQYPESRIIWMLLNGKIPKGRQIDHKDLNPLNNNIDNLRIATICQNGYNRKIDKRNKSGHKGVWYDKNKNRWEVNVNANGKRVFKRYFPTIELAIDAYKEVAFKYHGQFANLG